MRNAFRRAAVALPLLLVATLHPAPAEAVTASGGGVFSGAVNFSPGIPTDPTAPPNNNAFSFSSTTTNGTFVITDGTTTATYTGAVDVSAAGFGTETAAVGTGNFTSLSAGGSSVTGSLTASLAAPQEPGDNTYIRVGVTVIIILRLNVVITATVAGITITVVGLVTVRKKATAGTTTTAGNVTEASLVGPFTFASAS